MNGKSVREKIDEICRRLDEKFSPRALGKAAVIMSFPALTLIPACPYTVSEYGVYFEEEWDCSDGWDDDDDGAIDCADSDCFRVELCASCFDGQDNNGDGLADCADPDCIDTEGCVGTCDDGEDSDHDGLMDCYDPDCDLHPNCSD